MTTFGDIETERLRLRLLPPAALEATVAHDGVALAGLLGCPVPAEWVETRKLAAMRLEQLRHDPDYLHWSIRAVILREANSVVGYANFHARPGPHPLLDGATRACELGYTIFESYRRQGFAREVLNALLAWASAQGAEQAVLSISPDNDASLRLAIASGFAKIGSQIDEEDGPEDVYFLPLKFSLPP